MLTLSIFLGLGALVLVILCSFFISSNESRQEEQREPLPPASGLPCSMCGVVESAHFRMSSHPFTF